MGVIERVSRSLALGGTELTERALEREARRALASEAPWLDHRSAHRVVDEIIGLGPIQTLLGDPSITDILVNGPNQVWVDRGDGLELTDVRFSSDEHLVGTIERALAPIGLRVDRSMPMVDARLPDGSRLHAMLPPASVDYPLLTIRRFTPRVASLEDLVSAGAATRDQVDRLEKAVDRRMTLVISGGTGAGKTTLLNLLAGRIPGNERVVTIEDAAELSLEGHVVRLEARPPNAEGAGEITMRALLKSALRLRPDRIIVGEVRGAEALDLVSALNTGHRGSMTTVHANSPQEALWRLETLALSAGKTSKSVVSSQLRAAVDLVVQMERLAAGRVITAISPVAQPRDEDR